jgi:hypothetical protein
MPPLLPLPTPETIIPHLGTTITFQGRCGNLNGQQLLDEVALICLLPVLAGSALAEARC